MTQQRIFSFDSQILNTFSSCARKYQYTFIDNLRTPDKAEALEKGDLIHKGLEVYYSLQLDKPNFETEVWKELRGTGIFSNVQLVQNEKLKFNHQNLQTLSVQVMQYFATKMDLPTDEVNEVIHHFREYTNYFQHDSWHPLAVEEVGSKALFEDEELKLIYNFKIDMVAEKGNIIAPWDHKTSKRRQDPSSLSNQFIGYCYGLGLNNIIINKIGFQKTLSPKERFNRFILTIDNERISEWVENTIYWATQAIRAIDSDYFPLNLTSCDKYSGCIYSRLCESDPESRLYKIERDFKVDRPWDVAGVLEEKP